MTWIKTIDEAHADGRLAEAYERWINRAQGRVGHIIKIHSLHPQGLKAAFELDETVRYGQSGVSRRRREMIATVVSVLNGCHY